MVHPSTYWLIRVILASIGSQDHSKKKDKNVLLAKNCTTNATNVEDL